MSKNAAILCAAFLKIVVLSTGRIGFDGHGFYLVAVVKVKKSVPANRRVYY